MKKAILILILMITILNAYSSSLRVEPIELQKNIKKYKIIDTRAHDVYLNGHVKNAINFPVNLTYSHKKINGKLTDPMTMQKIIQNLGLHANDPIVIYDDGTFFDAARLFWALEVYGFTNIKLLNAGYKQWKKQIFSVSTAIPKITKSDYITIINNNRLATKFTTQIATKNPSQIIIDARPDEAYLGKISAAKRFGHIPKAINIPATHNINYDKKLSVLKGLHSLTDLYQGVDKTKKVVVYCAIGRIASTNYFAMRELGYDVANYDASWKEWGNDFKLPIINKSKE